jgi:hypothetical protein
LGNLVVTLLAASEKGEGFCPTTGLDHLEGGEGQESIGSIVRLTARGSSTDAQSEQGSKVGIPRQLEVASLDRCNTAELRDESLCIKPRQTA